MPAIAQDELKELTYGLYEVPQNSPASTGVNPSSRFSDNFTRLTYVL
ncbi:MAG: hypothetical protein BWZ10_03384 [candidate division BRC1 bacterium ADurb.BinA364]|nr:MAG: hypothetical protein BWZ10_03384 [candidate division BRC1 bacterium ADurb.BinA364]